MVTATTTLRCVTRRKAGERCFKESLRIFERDEGICSA
jgi:hypothetical protein